MCTLEFENRRPLYDWIIAQLIPEAERPHQYEFARLQLTYTVMSKRKLLQLVNEGAVSGWDDPRMLTLSGLRRRGYTPASIREFARRIGVSKTNSWIDMGVLEQCIREDLDTNAPRAMAVLRPLKVTVETWPEDKVDEVDLANHPKRPELGTRKVPFTRELYIEQDDFQEEPEKGFFRLAPGPRGAAARRVLHQVRAGGEGRRRAGWWSSSAVTTPRAAAASPPTAAR